MVVNLCDIFKILQSLKQTTQTGRYYNVDSAELSEIENIFFSITDGTDFDEGPKKMFLFALQAAPLNFKMSPVFIKFSVSNALIVKNIQSDQFFPPASDILSF